MAKYDTAELIETMKRRGLVPANQGTFEQSEFLKDASQEVEAHLVPLLIKSNSRVLHASEDQDLVAGQRDYLIPVRAASGGIIGVFRGTSDGREIPLTEDTASDEDHEADALGTPEFYRLDGAYIRLWPAPSDATEGLRVKYHRIPSRLVLTTEVATVSSVAAPSGGNVVVSLTAAVPSGLEGLKRLDFVRGRGIFDIMGIDATPSLTVVAGATTITFDEDDVPDGLGAGDIIALAGETAFPNVPRELHIAIALRGIAAALRANNDPELAESLTNEAAVKEREALVMLAPRVKGAAHAIANRTWFSPRRRRL